MVMTSEGFIIYSLAGFAAALAILLLTRAIRVKDDFFRYKQRLAKAISLPLGPMAIPASQIISGSPVFRSNTFGASGDGSTSSGLWECVGPTEFEWQYGTDETIYILEGSAELEYLGRSFTLRAGDCTHFATGTVARWVVRERIKKSFTLYEPGQVVRKMRRIVRMLGMGDSLEASGKVVRT
jgi:uncharacterized cupin superfamily protein